MSYTPKNLGHVVMRLRDMDSYLDFYTKVMGLTVMERSLSGTVFMSADTEKSHELAIRAIGMDANGPNHSIVGQAHMAWHMGTFEDLLKYSHDNENRETFKENPDDVLAHTNATHKEVPEWLKLLHRQEVLHQLELEKWHKILGTATDLLRQVG